MWVSGFDGARDVICVSTIAGFSLHMHGQHQAWEVMVCSVYFRWGRTPPASTLLWRCCASPHVSVLRSVDPVSRSDPQDCWCRCEIFMIVALIGSRLILKTFTKESSPPSMFGCACGLHTSSSGVVLDTLNPARHRSRHLSQRWERSCHWALCPCEAAFDTEVGCLEHSAVPCECSDRVAVGAGQLFDLRLSAMLNLILLSL